MAAQLILTRGLPGCGKSTWAQGVRSKAPAGEVVIVERDELRTQLFGEEYHRGNPDPRSEKIVTDAQQEMVKRALSQNKTVILPDTNLSPRVIRSWMNVSKRYGVPLTVKSFDVGVEECKRRNSERGQRGGREVPGRVIDNMAANSYDSGHLKDAVIGQNDVYIIPQVTPGGRVLQRYNRRLSSKHPMRGEAVVIVDVDGTLAHNWVEQDRAFGDRKKKDFDYFYRSIGNAAVNSNVVSLANELRDKEDIGIVVLTGRDDKYAKELCSFIERSGVKASKILAKRAGDYRSDHEFKKEAVEALHEEGLVIVHAIDDRPSSVALWESMGVQVSQVESHDPVSLSPGEERSYDVPTVDTLYGSGKCIRCGSPLKNGGNLGPKCRTMQ